MRDRSMLTATILLHGLLWTLFGFSQGGLDSWSHADLLMKCYNDLDREQHGEQTEMAGTFEGFLKDIPAK